MKYLCNYGQQHTSLSCIVNVFHIVQFFIYDIVYESIRHILTAPHVVLFSRAGSTFVAYMIFGVVYGTHKGEKGLNRLPNSDFWMELPLLVKVAPFLRHYLPWHQIKFIIIPTNSFCFLFLNEPCFKNEPYIPHSKWQAPLQVYQDDNSCYADFILSSVINFFYFVHLFPRLFCVHRME